MASVTEEAQALRLLEEALALPEARRQQWLEQQALPERLRARVASLLQAERDSTSFLAAPATPQGSLSFPLAGERLGNYELLEQLDAGGMGVVFRARRADAAFEQQVAIKLVQPQLIGAPALRESLLQRFEQERGLLARLEHPNIARIIDGGSTPAGIPYLVMEFVDGRSLLEHCDARQLDVRARLELFGDVCAGVQEAHRHLVVHRDIKPANILVDAQGRPRLLDFGIARALDAQPGAADPAMTVTAMTPAYASPEQVRLQPLSTSSDVYSLGVVLHELLAGQRPYRLDGLTPAQVEQAICHGRVPLLRESLATADLPEAERRRRSRQIGPDLERIAATAMHKDPDRRYGSAQALREDIRRYLRGDPVQAHPDSRAYRMRKFIERHRWGSAAAAMGVLLLAGAAAFSTSQAIRANQAAEDARSINRFLLDILEQSDPFDAGAEISLSQAIDQAASGLDQRFAARPDLAADIRFGVGYSMLSRYRLDAAEPMLQRALDDATRAHGALDVRTLRVREAIANLRLEQDRADQAQALYEQLIADLQRAGLQQDELYLTALNNLAMLHLTQERYADAERWLEQVREVEEQSAERDPFAHAVILSNLAQATHGLQKLDQAEGLYRQALAEFLAIEPSGSADAAITLNNLALLAEERGQTGQSLELHRRSLAIRRKVFAGGHPMVVVGLNNVARMSLRQDDVAAALAAAGEAAELADRVYTAPNARHASAHAYLADALLRDGRPEAAWPALQRAVALMGTVASPPAGAREHLDGVQARLCAMPGYGQRPPCTGPAARTR